MKTTKMIRYTGLGLLILSMILQMYLCSFTLFKEKAAKSEDQYAVLEISYSAHVFPKTGFDALFANMNLACDSLQIDKNSSLQDQQDEISAAIAKMNSSHVILFAIKDAGSSALSAAISNSEVASVILLCPTPDENSDASMFAASLPDLPVAIIDADTAYSTSLYERLSGEDATLLPGHKDSGFLSSTVFTSPDAKRYLCQWSFPWQSEQGKSILMFFPQNQIKTGEFISTFVIDNASLSGADIRVAVVRIQILTFLADAFLACGLLLFFASIPQNRRNHAVASENDPAVTQVLSRNVFFVTAIIAVLFGAGEIALYSTNILPASDILGGWPVIYYSVYMIFFFRDIQKGKSAVRISSKRILFSSVVAALFAGGLVLLVIMNTISNCLPGVNGRRAILLLVSILLAVFAWFRVSADELSLHGKMDDNTSRVWQAKWYQPVVLILPYIAVLIFGAATGRTEAVVRCCVLILAVALAAWTRHVFHRMSGTKWLAAIMFSLIYSLIAFA